MPAHPRGTIFDLDERGAATAGLNQQSMMRATLPAPSGASRRRWRRAAAASGGVVVVEIAMAFVASFAPPARAAGVPGTDVVTPLTSAKMMTLARRGQPVSVVPRARSMPGAVLNLYRDPARKRYGVSQAFAA